MRPIWEMLQNELTEVYTIHAVMSMKIIEDVEASLRSSIQNNNEYNTIKTVCMNHSSSTTKTYLYYRWMPVFNVLQEIMMNV